MVQSNGTATFHDGDGEVLASEDLGVRGVTAVAFDGADEPLLAAAGADGSIAVLNMTLWRYDEVERPCALLFEDVLDERREARPK